MDAQIKKLEQLKANGERLAATLDVRNADREQMLFELKALLEWYRKLPEPGMVPNAFELTPILRSAKALLARCEFAAQVQEAPAETLRRERVPFAGLRERLAAGSVR